MGVRDISILINRFAPSAVTRLSSSLSSFAGKTFAIDANLLTTKFFHAESHLDDRLQRHPTVRSWYRFLQALRRDNIKPIIVFDGDSRLLAKAGEVRRRVEARGLQRDRGSAEVDRSTRLAELSDAWAGGAEGFDNRIAVVQAFRDTVGGTERTTKLEVKDETALQRMLGLHGAFKSDESNPIYSANQRKITAVERSFYDENVDLEVSRNDLEEGRLQSTFLQESHQKRSLSLPSTSLAAVRDLVDAMGLPWFKPTIDDPYEAEAVCSTLHSHGLADYVVSEDTDVAVYGAPLLRRITTRSDKSIEWEEKLRRDAAAAGEEVAKSAFQMNILDPVVLRKEFGLSRAQFVDLALLCGTDFTERIPGLGPIRALPLIQKFGTIEGALESQTKYQPTNRSEYLHTIDVARGIFMNLPPLPDVASLQSRSPASDLYDVLADSELDSPDTYR